MLDFVLNKYFSNFKKIVPYLLAQIVFNVLLAKLFIIAVPKPNIINFTGGSSGFNFQLNSNTIGAIGGSSIILLIITFITAPIFAVFIRLITRNILDDKAIDHGEILKESFNYYWRFIGFTLLMILIFLGIFAVAMIFGFIPIVKFLVIIAVIIFIIYLVTILTPCIEYMIYDDLTIEEAFSSGKTVGKENFLQIFFLALITGIISGFFKTDNTRSVIIVGLFVFIAQAIDAFKIMYIMSLCKQDKEGKYPVYPSEY